jgi:aldose 1-epimerase
MPDVFGHFDDILLGFSTLSGYAAKHPYFGATIGRFANRIGNSSFTINEKIYQLWANNNNNHLHGGRKGFDKYIWKYDISTIKGNPALKFSRTSINGEEGYPGTLQVEVIISLSAAGELTLHYIAVSDEKTPVNLTNHAYFNLKGEGKGTILDHLAQLEASEYLPVDAHLIPTGKISSVKGTALDFRAEKPIGLDIATLENGYDFCYIIDKELIPLKDCAQVREPSNNRLLKVATSLPAIQFYTGNNLRDVMGKCGSVYEKYAGFCLETEMYPDAPNHENFPTSYIAPGETWDHTTVYTFSIQK